MQPLLSTYYDGVKDGWTDVQDPREAALLIKTGLGMKISLHVSILIDSYKNFTKNNTLPCNDVQGRGGGGVTMVIALIEIKIISFPLININKFVFQPITNRPMDKTMYKLDLHMLKESSPKFSAFYLE